MPNEKTVWQPETSIQNVHQQAENEALTIPKRGTISSLHARTWSSFHSLLVMLLPSFNMSPNTVVRINLLHAELLSFRVCVRKLDGPNVDGADP